MVRIKKLQYTAPMNLLTLIQTYGDTHLIVDGKTPLISEGSVQEEALLYQLDSTRLSSMLIEASAAINQEITPKTLIHTLSGGQQIVLAVYLALHSLAEKIIFVEIFSSLDSDRRAMVQSLFDKEPAGRVTILEGENSV